MGPFVKNNVVPSSVRNASTVLTSGNDSSAIAWGAVRPLPLLEVARYVA